jgi:hypothetical protein
VNRTDFQELARVRLDEANALLQAGYFDGAYYLAGYAVECGLKACIAKLTKQFDFPPDRRVIDRVYSHDLDGLLVAARLDGRLEADASADPILAANWSTAKDWSEQSRYTKQTREQAESLYNAITDSGHGVLAWLHGHW